MYLSDEEVQIINQALDDAKEMKEKYSNALRLLEDQNTFLAEIIIKNGLAEAAVEQYEMQSKILPFRAKDFRTKR